MGASKKISKLKCYIYCILVFYVVYLYLYWRVSYEANSNIFSSVMPLPEVPSAYPQLEQYLSFIHMKLD